MACESADNQRLGVDKKKTCNGDCKNCGAVSALLERLEPSPKLANDMSLTQSLVGITSGSV